MQGLWDEGLTYGRNRVRAGRTIDLLAVTGDKTSLAQEISERYSGGANEIQKGTWPRPGMNFPFCQLVSERRMISSLYRKKILRNPSAIIRLASEDGLPTDLPSFDCSIAARSGSDDVLLIGDLDRAVHAVGYEAHDVREMLPLFFGSALVVVGQQPRLQSRVMCGPALLSGFS